MERESYTDTWTTQKRLFTVWPWKVLRGRSLPRRHTWMHMSVLQEAKVELFCQSTSSAGAVEYFKMHTAALMRRFLRPRDNHSWTGKKIQQRRLTVPEWNGNCCLASPVCASQMIVVCKIKLCFSNQECKVSKSFYHYKGQWQIIKHLVKIF